MAEEKEIILSVKTDTSQASAGVDDLKGKLEGVNNTVLDKPFKTFKAEIKEAVIDAQRLEAQFGKNSVEFATAAKRVAELKDRFGEFNQSIEGFNPDNKLQALVSVAKGATGAIQGVTGAMQFLGLESSTAEAAIAKLQGLMAFSQALNSVDDIKNGFKNFNTVLQSSTFFQKANNAATVAATVIQRLFGASVVGTGAAFNILKGAIIATGIGALLVGVGLLINKISDWASSTDKAKVSQESLKTAVDALNDSLDNQSHALSRANSEAIALAKSKGASETEIFNLIQKNAKEEEAILLKKRDNLHDYYFDVADLADKGKATIEDEAAAKKAYYAADAALEDNRSKQRIAVYDANNKAREKSIADEKAAEAKRKKDQEDNKKKKEDNDKKEVDAITKFYDDKLAEINKGNEAERIAYENENEIAAQATEDKLAAIEAAKALALQNADNKATVGTAGVVKAERVNSPEEEDNSEEAKAKIQAILEAKLLEEQAQFEAKKLRAQGNNAELELIEEEHLTNDTNLKKEAAEANKLIDEAEHEAKVAMVNATGNLLAQGAALAGKHTVAGKAMAVASTTIQTYQSATSAFAGMTSSIPGPVGIALGVVAAAFAVATGVANIKKILAVKVPNAAGSGGGVPTPTAGAAPTILAAATAQQAIQNVRVTNNPNQQPTRAYIVNSDLVSNEQKNKFLNSVSTF